MSLVPVCVPVTVDVNQDIFDVDKLAVGISFFLGFLIGLAITVACLKMCCIKDLSKKKVRGAMFISVYVLSRSVFSPDS